IVATRLGPTTAEARLVFGPDGDVTGSTGCNSFRTRAETAPAATVPDQTTRTDTGPSETGPSETAPAETGPSDTGPSETGPSETGPSETGPQLSGRLVFTGPMRATERACLDRDLAAQERAILDAIAATARFAWNPDTGRLTLYDRHGALVLALLPAP
ncbi:MAG: META domain-containing protein, partial [Pseudomonadota bacterium]